MMCGIGVVRRDGAPVGFGRGTVRSLAGLLTPLTFGLAAALVVFNRDRRGLGDLVAGTRLVRVASVRAQRLHGPDRSSGAPPRLCRAPGSGCRAPDRRIPGRPPRGDG